MRPDQPKKGLEQANKQIWESTFAEPTRNAGHLGDLAKWLIITYPRGFYVGPKSTYNPANHLQVKYNFGDTYTWLRLDIAQL